MAHRTAHHRRRDAHHRTHSEAVYEPQRADVLLSTDHLVSAHRHATEGGKKTIEGLYLPSGQRVEALGGAVQQGGFGDEGARKDQALSRLAATYQGQVQTRRKKCQKEKKTIEQMDDEESKRKAKKVLDHASDHEVGAYKNLFDFFDVDKDKTWGSIEFAQRMSDVGCNTSVESASNLLYFAGVRDVDRITYEDFLLMMPKLKAYRLVLEKDAMRAFGEKDLAGTGFLSRKQLRDVIQELAGPDGMDHHAITQLVRKADRERTGRIPFPFFVQALFGTPPMLEYKPKPQKKGWIAALFGCGSSGQQHKPEEDGDEI